ncbi:LLM class flavin-dependent oxidoreductase [Amycolatopsis magusensis]|uniref:Alkanesulfonate monooxygenase SsuD/methylene tetrahydromethanopterin reductase-like flavin-dependent oxidoreductase (Luciferase family) n=1 Tax=Amycolatopsis magusensis TaxID=882444 RepID=A0ABS4PZU3_9PSEU|nr:LLM class flavin-dependent oxidoreductase [Amycolatopsis magusensis]MBP2184949.1 alkanesulfonate monooxygenase SsuD/methylene tetrahydromethanopterin reductase-like flavin-dependent oxidoreductase (luciferase family) [Amycolatopsis magusensis]
MNRVGVMIPCRLPPARLVGLVRRAEEAGLDEVWVVEDCFYTGGVATAAAALAATERITVGIGVLPTVARNPAIAAMELATLAGLHPGRLIAGFGHGVPSWMRQIGAYPPSPLAALRETLTVVRGLLNGERISLQGKHVQLDDVQLEFPPEVVPRVLSGVRGPRSLAVSGAAADGTILAEPSSPEYVRAALASIAEGAGEPGAPEHHSIVAYNWFALDEDPAQARARVRPWVVGCLRESTAPHIRPLPFAGDLLSLIEQKADLAAELPPEWVDRLSISGNLERCVEQVRALHGAGAESVVLIPVGDEEQAVAAAGEVAAAARN